MLTPVTLSGRHVRLEPLAPRHTEALYRNSRDVPEVWRFMSFVDLADRQSLSDWIDSVQDEGGASLAFAIVSVATGEAVGSTSLLDYSAQHRRVEIGRTWLGRAFWRTAFNTEAKLLLLGHAFEVLGCNRVQLKTDSRNERSQAAIARLGATREGVLRSHMVMGDGHIRDSVMFSIIRPEWPAVKTRLEAALAR